MASVKYRDPRTGQVVEQSDAKLAQILLDGGYVKVSGDEKASTLTPPAAPNTLAEHGAANAAKQKTSTAEHVPTSTSAPAGEKK